MTEPDLDAAKPAQRVPDIAWMTEAQLGALLEPAPAQDPRTAQQYRQLVIANAARAEVMRRALRLGW